MVADNLLMKKNYALAYKEHWRNVLFHEQIEISISQIKHFQVTGEREVPSRIIGEE